MCWMKDSKLYYISQDHELYLFLVFHSLMCLEILYSEHKLMKCLLQCTLCKLIPVVGNRCAWTLLLGFFEILSVICIHMLIANYWWHFLLCADSGSETCDHNLDQTLPWDFRGSWRCQSIKQEANWGQFKENWIFVCKTK